MAAIEPLYHLLNINLPRLTKEEKLILEVELFTHLCDELKLIFKNKYSAYFHLIKMTERENTMIETDFIRFVINDILSSKAYSLQGIAYYTETTEDVICDIVLGQNMAPSFSLSRKIIHLHRTARPQLYQAIVNKIIQPISA